MNFTAWNDHPDIHSSISVPALAFATLASVALYKPALAEDYQSGNDVHAEIAK
jgi:hypothetical protein